MMNCEPCMSQVSFFSPGFIVGVGRSGTTLLASLLNRHPDICVTSETHFFRLLNTYPGGWGGVTKCWPESGVAFLQSLHHYYLLNVDAGEVVSLFPVPPSSPGDLFAALGFLYARNHGKRHWVEKTPLHLHYLPLIRSTYPDSPIIHIIRDGRDVALSLCKVPDWASDGFIHNLNRWAGELAETAEFFEEDRRSLIVKYENLIQSTVPTLERICEFLGISFTTKMLVPDGTEDSLIESDVQYKDNIKKSIIPNNSEKWRNIDSDILVAAHGMFGGDLARWGYVVPNSAENDWPVVRVCKDLSVSDDHIKDIAPRPLLDNFFSEISRFKLAPRLSQLDLFESKIEFSDKIWVFKYDVPVFERTNLIKRMVFKTKLLLRLAHLRWRKIDLVWVYEQPPQNAVSWDNKYRQSLERMVARGVSKIICTCENRIQCDNATYLNVAAQKVGHLRQLDGCCDMKWVSEIAARVRLG